MPTKLNSLWKPKQSQSTILTNRIINDLIAHGHWAWRNHTTGIRGRSVAKHSRGIGDILAIICGVHCEFEIKIGTDEQSQDQIRHMGEVLRCGGKYFVIKTFEEYLKIRK